MYIQLNLSAPSAAAQTQLKRLAWIGAAEAALFFLFLFGKQVGMALFAVAWLI